MKVKLARWGNSLGVRIPKAAAVAAGLKAGMEVDVVVEGRDLRIRPSIPFKYYRLEDLIAEMDRLGPENRPEVVDWGPAVVLTDREFHKRNDTAIISPTTSNKRPRPTKIILPDGLAVRGAILVDQVRSLDRSARGFRSVGRVPDQVLDEVRGRLAGLLGIVHRAEV